MLATAWHEEEVAQQRRDHFMQEAEHERLVRSVTSRELSTVDQLRRRLGTWLVTAGQRIQAQPTHLRNAHEW